MQSDNDNNLSNIGINELDLNVVEKLRGDAIGSTLYSESFVLKTLLGFSNFQWSKQFEESLCFLWDMTLEKEVCEYLVELSFPNIACDAICKYDNDRFTEIIIGILANIYSVICKDSIPEYAIGIVFDVLESSDPLILIQVVRFIKASTYAGRNLRFITNNVMNRLLFILSNSASVDLLLNTLDTISKITVDRKLSITLIKGELIASVIIAYRYIHNGEHQETKTNQQQLAQIYFIQIISNVCCYINEEDSSDQLLIEVQEHSNKLIEDISDMLNYYSKEDTQLPVSKELQFLMDTLVFMFQLLNVKYNKQIFTNLIIIMERLLRYKSTDVNYFYEIICYFISVGQLNDLVLDLEDFSKSKALSVLCYINDSKLDWTFEYNHNLKVLIEHFHN